MLSIHGFAKKCGITPYFTVDNCGCPEQSVQSYVTLYSYNRYKNIAKEANEWGFSIPMTVLVDYGNGYKDIEILVEPDKPRHTWSF